MQPFDLYASYYDCLYHDKNYALESDYVDALIKRYHTSAQTILEFGSGTGKHALLLAEKGYNVHGIDVSERMLTIARERLAQKPSLASHVLFSCQDARHVTLPTLFDVVIALFHVISYQTTHQDLLHVFNAASRHVSPGGLFIFDCWYGPAVLAQQPAVRVKRFENENIGVTRIAEPDMQADQQYVDVRFSIYIHDKQKQDIHFLQENHRMRYLFYEEIETLFSQTGFSLIAAEEWMTGNMPSTHTWGVCFVGKKI